jgi:DNA-binding NtrC family response regulator
VETILIADDVPEYVDSLARALAGLCDVLKATSVSEAKEKMSSRVRLALIDVRFSEEHIENRDGVHLLVWLKQNYPQVTVLMMSAYRDFDSAVEALNQGADQFLKKPINLRELKTIVNNVIGGAA